MNHSKTQTDFPLSPKKVIKKTLGATIAWIILLGIVLGILGLINLNRGEMNPIFGTLMVAIFTLLILIVLATYLYQQWYLSTYFYDLAADYIVIKKDPITPREITIPYERIQDVYVDQDILDRIFGLYDVHLSSATISSGMEAHIDGVEKNSADGLRAILLQTVKERISKNKK